VSELPPTPLRSEVAARRDIRRSGLEAKAPLEPLLTLRDTASLLRVSERSVRRLVAYRRIPCLRIGRQLRFVPSDLLRWVSARKEGG